MIHHDEATMTEADLDALHPDTRAIAEPAGVPVVLGDGRTWLLAWAGVARVLDAARDRMDDAARLRGQVEMSDVYDVAHLLLRANYELSGAEAAGLLLEAGRDALATAAMAALFGEPKPRRTFTKWMMSSLYAAGLDPERIPPEWIPHVLDQLVSTGRAVPVGDYIDSAVAAPKLAALRARAARTAAEKAAADPEPEAGE